MTEGTVISLLLIGTSIALAALLLVVHRRLQGGPVVRYWGLYWALEAFLYLAGAVLYVTGNLAHWPALTLLPVFGFQISLLVAAGEAARGRVPSRAEILLTGTGVCLVVLLAGGFGFAMRGWGEPGNVFLAVCNFVVGGATAYFAFALARSQTLVGLGNRITIWISIALSIQDVVYAFAALGVGPYQNFDSPVPAILGIMLQLAVAFGIVVSVLEKALAEANRAAESDRRFRSLLESVQLSGMMLDRDGTITFVNQCLIDVSGYSRDEVLGRKWLELFEPPGSRNEFREALEGGLMSGRLPGYYQGPLTTKTGTERVIGWTNTLMRGPKNDIAGCACLGYDLTDQLRLEEQFRRTQRLESIGRLAGGIAHDFNNHLTVINGYCQLLLNQMPADSALTNFVKETLVAGERAGKLTQQLLAFGRRQVLEPVRIAPAAVVRDLITMLRRLVREDIELVFELADDAGSVDCDPSQLEQVVVNLVVNARDAITGRGRIVIEVANEELDHSMAARHADVQPGPYVLLAVSDNGAGMDAAIQERAFEPFFTTKPPGEGTGLGMAVVHGIVRQSGGWIWLYSEPGEGTTVKVYFPLTAREAQAPQNSLPIADASGGKEVVLLVEDREDVRELARCILVGGGYTVVESANGKDAIRLVEERGVRFDLLVTDVVMPEMNGWELAEWMEKNQPGIKVLYVSGYTPTATTHQGNLKDDIYYLAKPYAPNQLLTRVRDALDGR